MSSTQEIDLLQVLPPLLTQAGALNGIAELQGVLCGYLSGGLRFADHDWVNLAKEALDLAEDPGHDLNDALVALYHQSLKQLMRDDFGFVLLLPADEADLSLRSEALGEWCQGFLVGIGHTGLGQQDSLDEEVLEMLSDLVAISQIDISEMSEDLESDYFAVAEYVRMSAIKLFMEFNSKDVKPAVH